MAQLARPERVHPLIWEAYVAIRLAGFDPVDLCAWADTDLKQWYFWKTGRRTPRVETLDRVLRQAGLRLAVVKADAAR